MVISTKIPRSERSDLYVKEIYLGPKKLDGYKIDLNLEPAGLRKRK